MCTAYITDVHIHCAYKLWSDNMRLGASMVTYEGMDECAYTVK